MKIFAANWKLNKNPNEARSFMKEFTQLLAQSSQSGSFSTTHKSVVIFPSAFSLEAVVQSALQAQSTIQIGAQNTYFESKGAFTGENSVQIAKDIGASWILIGHSERRALFNEKDQELTKKVKHTQDSGLSPMYCIGETLQEREANQTNEILSAQLEKGLSLADKNKSLAIAYEPVWAIGTGKVATSAQVKETHQFVREKLTSLGFNSSTPILYGGSVKSDNAKELIQIPNVDGFLVGGASLEPQSFFQICSAI